MLSQRSSVLIIFCLFLLSVVANGYFLYERWDRSPAHKKEFQDLFPGIEINETYGPFVGKNIDQLLKYSFVFVSKADDGRYALIAIDRDHCKAIEPLQLAEIQPTALETYLHKPILVKAYHLERDVSGMPQIALEKIELDTFAEKNKERLEKACPFPLSKALGK